MATCHIATKSNEKVKAKCQSLNFEIFVLLQNMEDLLIRKSIRGKPPTHNTRRPEDKGNQDSKQNFKIRS